MPEPDFNDVEKGALRKLTPVAADIAAIPKKVNDLSGSVEAIRKNEIAKLSTRLDGLDARVNVFAAEEKAQVSKIGAFFSGAQGFLEKNPKVMIALGAILSGAVTWLTTHGGAGPAAPPTPPAQVGPAIPGPKGTVTTVNEDQKRDAERAVQDALKALQDLKK
jgi:hypothetical protein